MPGPIVHMIVQQRFSAYLREFGGERGQKYARILNDDPCSPYSGFGSMGPDFLFFSLKEYGTPLDEIANFWFEVYDAFKPLIDFYEDNIEPVIDDIENAISSVDKALFDGLFQQIGDTADLLTATAVNVGSVLVTQNIDLYYPFYPKVQQGKPETDWYWVDMLHERRTGMFTSHMWQLAMDSGDIDLQRYVLGYASHFCTDVVGHSAVNAITGGPFRTHWHRHKLVENWIDAYARTYYKDTSKLINCLKLGSQDAYVPNAISGSYYYRLLEFPGSKLPNKLSEMLAKAIKNVYNGVPHPSFLSASDLDTTYRLFLKWFEKMTTISDAQPPTPVPPPGAATINLINDFVSGYPSFSSSGGSGGGGGFSILDIFAAIFAFVKWLIEGIAYTIQWIITHSIDILTLPFTEALALVKWLLYQIQKGIWEVYDNLRFMLVLGGYLNPEPRDLNKSPWGQTFINTSYVHLTGGPFPDFYKHPRKQESHGLFGTTEHHLVYPGVISELPHAEPAPYPFYGVNPEAFISKGHPYDPNIEKLYDCIAPYGPDKRFTHFVDSSTWLTSQLGSAFSFSGRLISQRLDNLPNLNLNSDRGYGWKTWKAADPDIEGKNPISVEYVDAKEK